MPEKMEKTMPERESELAAMIVRVIGMIGRPPARGEDTRERYEELEREWNRLCALANEVRKPIAP